MNIAKHFTPINILLAVIVCLLAIIAHNTSEKVSINQVFTFEEDK